MTIALYHSKGGVAKSSTVVHLARLWNDRAVTVYDIDHQQRSRKFAPGIPGVEFVYCDAVEVPQRLDGSRINLIDCPPFPNLARPAFRVADLVIIPFTSESASWDEVPSCWNDVHTERGDRPVKIVTFLSRYYPERPQSRAIRVKAINEYGDALLSTTIRNLAVFDTASFYGLTVLDHSPNSEAARKIRALGEELDQLLGMEN